MIMCQAGHKVTHLHHKFALFSLLCPYIIFNNKLNKNNNQISKLHKSSSFFPQTDTKMDRVEQVV